MRRHRDDCHHYEHAECGKERAHGERRHTRESATPHRARDHKQRDDRDPAEGAERDDHIVPSIEGSAERDDRGHRGKRDGTKEKIAGDPVGAVSVRCYSGEGQERGKESTRHGRVTDSLLGRTVLLCS